jgi:hypothetical protein
MGNTSLLRACGGAPDDDVQAMVVQQTHSEVRRKVSVRACAHPPRHTAPRGYKLVLTALVLPPLTHKGLARV